jgi:hypothetical protein
VASCLINDPVLAWLCVFAIVHSASEGEGGEEEKEADGTTAVVCASLDEEGGLGSD